MRQQRQCGMVSLKHAVDPMACPHEAQLTLSCCCEKVVQRMMGAFEGRCRQQFG